MATRHQTTAHYPAPAAAVLRMFADKAFHLRKLEKIGLKEFRVLEHAHDGNDFHMRVERKVPVNLPGMKKGATSTVIHNESWNTKTRRGQVDVELSGMPLTMHCESRAEDAGDGCVVHYDWTVTSKVPLVGGKIEKFVIADMDKQAEPERLAGVDLLDQYRD